MYSIKILVMVQSIKFGNGTWSSRNHYMIFVYNSDFMLNKYNKENVGINFNSEFIFYIRNLDQKNVVLESSSEIEIEECIFEGFNDNYQAVTFFYRIHGAYELYSFRKFKQRQIYPELKKMK